MSHRFVLVAAVLALVSGACGAGPDPAAEAGPVMARPLAYSLTGAVSLDYHTEMETEMTTTFGDALTAIDPSMPSQMMTQMEMSFDSNYMIEDGPEPGSYRVAMTLDNVELGSGSIEMGREKIDISEVPKSEIDAALAAQMPEFVYIIDDKGEVISVEFGGMTVDVDSLLGGTSSNAFSSGQMFGPQLPEGEVNVGDTWTTTSTQEFGDNIIETEETHTILRTEERNGFNTWVIKTKATTGAYTISWQDLIAMFEEIGGIQNVDGMADMPPSFQMAMRSSPTSTTMVTWLDPEMGRTVATDITGNVSMTMEMGGIPGMPGSISMGMDGYTHLTMELVP